MKNNKIWTTQIIYNTQHKNKTKKKLKLFIFLIKIELHKLIFINHE